MSKLITVELSAPVLAYVERQAHQLSLSVEDWLTSELELQCKMQQQTELFFQERRARARPGALDELLASVPDGPPIPGDELPEPRHI